MNSIFLAILTLVLAQGLTGHHNVGTKFVARVFVALSVTAFLFSLDWLH